MKEGAEIFTIARGDSAYPPLLAREKYAPKKLYIRGNSALLQTECFAVIGSRRVSDYGRRALEAVLPPVARVFTIVSGMALGADAVAHCIALQCGTPTIAVLGNGLDDDTLYPRTHVSLAHKILDAGGCLVSEYPPGERAHPQYFPARNRIVAWLSHGVLIAEATLDSGTMITAKFALDASRDVFAIPGSIFSSLCAGTNDLLRQGATAVSSGRDILHAFGLVEPTTPDHPHSDPDMRRIIACLTEGSKTTDELLAATGCTASSLMTLLSELELTGTIGRAAGSFVLLTSARCK